MAVLTAHVASVDCAEGSISLAVPSRIDSTTGLASDSSRLIQPLLQDLHNHLRVNLGLANGQLGSSLPPRSANMRPSPGSGKRFISHIGHASSLVDGFSLQNRHDRNTAPPQLDTGCKGAAKRSLRSALRTTAEDSILHSDDGCPVYGATIG